MNTEQDNKQLETQPDAAEEAATQGGTAENAENTEKTGSTENLENTEKIEEAETAEDGPREEETGETKEEAPAPKPQKLHNANKWKRGSLATLMTVVFIAIVVAVNVLVSALTQRFPSMDIDLTAQKLNSLSDQALGVAKGVEQDTEIFLVGTEEAYRKDLLYSNYGIKYSQVVTLVQRLQEANSHIKWEFKDPDTDPELMSQYAEENLTNGMVLVRTEKRHKILSVADMFDLQQNQTTGGTETYTKADSALASALELVNLDTVPVLTMATGHNEMLPRENIPQFTGLVEDQNFTIEEADLMTEEIPENTQVLMIGTPVTDYTDEELQKIRDYLNDNTRKEPVTLLVTCHPTQGELPKLSAFLEEWGVKVESGVVAETDSSRVHPASASYVFVDRSGDTLSENSYNRLLAPSSSPLTLLFSNNNDISTSALWSTADSAYVITESTTEEEAQNPETSKWAVATISSKNVETGEGYSQRNVVVFGSSYVFTDSFLESNYFGNRAYLSDLLKYTTGTDGSAVTVQTESVQMNTLDVTASHSTVTLLGLGVFTVGLPLLILAAGLVIFLKRRHL